MLNFLTRIIHQKKNFILLFLVFVAVGIILPKISLAAIIPADTFYTIENAQINWITITPARLTANLTGTFKNQITGLTYNCGVTNNTPVTTCTLQGSIAGSGFTGGFITEGTYKNLSGDADITHNVTSQMPILWGWTGNNGLGNNPMPFLKAYVQTSEGEITVEMISGIIKDGKMNWGTQIVVSPPYLARIDISPINVPLRTGDASPLSIRKFDQFGDPFNSQATTTWESSAETIASVTQSGFVTAVGVGIASINAKITTENGLVRSNTSVVTVSLPVVVTVPSITISCLPTTLSIDDTSQCSPVLHDFSPANTILPTWKSETLGVATITTSGLVAAVGAGTTKITASIGVVSGFVTITVNPTTISIVPAASNLVIGNTVDLKVVDENDEEIPDTDLDWFTDSSGIAVSSTGVVSANSAARAGNVDQVAASLKSGDGETTATITITASSGLGGYSPFTGVYDPTLDPASVQGYGGYNPYTGVRAPGNTPFVPHPPGGYSPDCIDLATGLPCSSSGYVADPSIPPPPGGSTGEPPVTPVIGCTDHLATNYNPQANQSGGSCDYLTVNSSCDDPAGCVLVPVTCDDDQILNPSDHQTCIDPPDDCDPGEMLNEDGTACTDWTGEACAPSEVPNASNGGACVRPDVRTTRDGGTCGILEVVYPTIPGAGAITGCTTLPEYILYFFNLMVFMAGFAALFIFVTAGIKMITSAGNAGAIGDARDMMISAALGIILLLLTYLILKTINPALLTLTNL